MHQIYMQTRVRFQIEQATAPEMQSAYIFNMYRAGSSVTEAVAETLSKFSPLVPLNITRLLDQIGVEVIDHMDFRRTSVFLSASENPLVQLGEYGGFLHYGYREVPPAFSESFQFIGASVIIVRDLRDIGLSQYRAVNKHITTGSSGKNIKQMRQDRSDQDLESFLLSPELLEFLKRISNCYRPMIQKGVKLLKYEDFFENGKFNTNDFFTNIAYALADYVPLEGQTNDIIADLDARINNSRSLKDHATSGKINLYKELDTSVQMEMTAALENELKMLGYLD
ncbi:MAG: hypothetical protein AAF198_04510 [Pseudomonadota bacterium]